MAVMLGFLYRVKWCCKDCSFISELFSSIPLTQNTVTTTKKKPWESSSVESTCMQKALGSMYSTAKQTTNCTWGYMPIIQEPGGPWGRRITRSRPAWANSKTVAQKINTPQNQHWVHPSCSLYVHYSQELSGK
jgi:hypothetical protein